MHQNRADTAKSLFGILPQDADLYASKEERLGVKQMNILADTNVIIPDDFVKIMELE